MRDKRVEGLSSLGSGTTNYVYSYDPELLESFVNRHPENDYFVELNCPEFTSICPITGQPDFGKIKINYVPDQKLVESKSLKLYLFSFRNHGDFHEDVINIIMNDLIALLAPNYIEVLGDFTPRGGISIHPWVNMGKNGSRWEAFAEARRLNFLQRGSACS